MVVIKKCAALAELLFLLIKPIDFFWTSSQTEISQFPRQCRRQSAGGAPVQGRWVVFKSTVSSCYEKKKRSKIKKTNKQKQKNKLFLTK